MKFFLAIFMSFSTLTVFASTLAEDLANKQCSFKMKKSVRLYENEGIKSAGNITFMSMFLGRDSKLKKGKSYSILDESQGIIAIGYEQSVILSCISDSSGCIKDLSLVKTSEVLKLSEGIIEIQCKE